MFKNYCNKKNSLGVIIILICVLTFTPQIKPQQLPSFPGAEGSGANAIGGRFGTVYKVTNLNSSGPGSLKDAVSQPNRIIIFTVSGIIDMGGKMDIKQDNLTIAGQTAPGDGICLKHTSVHVGGKNVIIRYLRSRVGYMEKNGVPWHVDGLSADIDGGEDIIIDHCSVSWASDENLTQANKTVNVTVQNCIIAEGLNYFDPNNQPNRHGFGSIIGSDIEGAEVNYHHNLYAHHERRSPRFASRGGYRNLVDFRNNVIYDCYNESGLNNDKDAINANYIGNYYKYGPNTPDYLKYQLFNLRGKYIRMYAEDNYVFNDSENTVNNWNAMEFTDGSSLALAKVDTLFATTYIKTESPQDAYQNVLENGGAVLPRRDMNDTRIVNEVINGTGKEIEYETDLGNNPWGKYYSLPYPTDTDNDGIPDYWEDQFRLNKNDPSDNMNIASNGYANIENYFNNVSPVDSEDIIVYAESYISRTYRSGSQNGEWKIFRTGNLYSDLDVKYYITGTASSDEYEKLNGNVTIHAGQSYASIILKPLTENIPSGSRTVILNIKQDTSNTYYIGCPSQALIVISDSLQTTGGVGLLKENIPAEFMASNNYPNPFNPGTYINYTVNKREHIKLTIYDLEGRVVCYLINKEILPGDYKVYWDGKYMNGTQAPSGIYFYNLADENNSLTRKMVLLK